MTLIPFGRKLKSLGRLRHVAGVLTRHGYGWLVLNRQTPAAGNAAR